MNVYTCDWMQTTEVRRLKRTFWQRVKQGLFRPFQIEIVVTPIEEVYAIGDTVFMHPSMYERWITDKTDENIVLTREAGRGSGTTTAMIHRLIESLVVDNHIKTATLEAHTNAYGCQILENLIKYSRQRGYEVGRIFRDKVQIEKKWVVVNGGMFVPNLYTDHHKEGIG